MSDHNIVAFKLHVTMVTRQNLINTYFCKCLGETNNSSISLLILMCLVLTKCVFNGLLSIRFAQGFDTLYNVILYAQICTKINFEKKM